MKLIYKVTYYKSVPDYTRSSSVQTTTKDIEAEAFVACSDVKSIFKHFDKLKSVEFICEVTQEM